MPRRASPRWLLSKRGPRACTAGTRKQKSRRSRRPREVRPEILQYIEIIPAAKDSTGKLQPTTLPLPGHAQSIDCWVWGSNYNYTLDIYIRDYQGIDHVLHMGSLRFAGWKDLSAPISGAIPQSRMYIPRYAGLELTKMVIRTAPDEKVDDFYFFVDEINVLTDLSTQRFDGEDLADPDTLNNLWQQGTK